MDEKITKLMETAIKIKDAFSCDEIRLQYTEDFARAIVTVTALNDLKKFYQIPNDFETRLVPVADIIEIRLYVYFND